MATAIEQFIQQRDLIADAFEPARRVERFENQLALDKVQRQAKENALRSRMALDNQFSLERQRANFDFQNRQADAAAMRRARENAAAVLRDSNVSGDEQQTFIEALNNPNASPGDLNALVARVGQASQLNDARQGALASTAALEALGGLAVDTDPSVAPSTPEFTGPFPLDPNQVVQGPVAEDVGLRQQIQGADSVNELAALQAGLRPRLATQEEIFKQDTQRDLANRAARASLTRTEKMLLVSRGIDPAQADLTDISAIKTAIAEDKDLSTLANLQLQRDSIMNRLLPSPEAREQAFDAVLNNPGGLGGILDEDLEEAAKRVREAMDDAKMSSMAELESAFERSASGEVSGLDIETFNKVKAAAAASTGASEEAIKSTYRSVRTFDEQIGKFIAEKGIGLQLPPAPVFGEKEATAFKDALKDANPADVRLMLEDLDEADPRVSIINEFLGEAEESSKGPVKITDAKTAEKALKDFEKRQSSDRSSELDAAVQELKVAREQLNRAYNTRVHGGGDNFVVGGLKRLIGKEPSFEINRRAAIEALEGTGVPVETASNPIQGLDFALERAKLALGPVFSENPEGFVDANVSKLKQEAQLLRAATEALINQQQ